MRKILLTPEVRKQVIEKIKAGVPIIQIASEFGMKTNTIYNFLIKHHGGLRTFRKPFMVQSNKRSKESRDQFYKLLKEGKTLSKISNILFIPIPTLKSWKYHRDADYTVDLESRISCLEMQMKILTKKLMELTQ